jgi:hypothetical protein
MWQATAGMLAAWMLFAIASVISPHPILLAFTLAMAVSFTLVLLIHIVAFNMRRRASSQVTTRPVPLSVLSGGVVVSPLSSDSVTRTQASPPRGCAPCREREAKKKLHKTYADSGSTPPVRA